MLSGCAIWTWNSPALNTLLCLVLILVGQLCTPPELMWPHRATTCHYPAYSAAGVSRARLVEPAPSPLQVPARRSPVQASTGGPCDPWCLPAGCLRRLVTRHTDTERRCWARSVVQGGCDTARSTPWTTTTRVSPTLSAALALALDPALALALALALVLEPRSSWTCSPPGGWPEAPSTPAWTSQLSLSVFTRCF
jgi:hypothetical protein